MARGTQHRKRRPQANARVAQPSHTIAQPKPKRVQHQKWEDQLFFARLRNHGRILWLLLTGALILAFVLLGVGSGSSGISSIVSNFFSGTSASGQVALVAPEADGRPSEERRRLARVCQQAPAGQQARRGRSCAHDLHDAEAEGPGRAAAAGRDLPPPGRRLADGLPGAAGSHPGVRADLDAVAQVGHPARPGDHVALEPARERGLGGHELGREQRLPAVRERADAA